MFIDLQQEKHSIKINNLISMTLYHFYLSLGFIKIIAHLKINWLIDGCCCSVAQLCLTLCNPMDFSMPGFPVLYHLPELAQTPVHWVGDAIQPSHPLSSPSSAFNLCQNLSLQSFPRVFSNESVLRIRWPKYWSFSFSFSPSNEYSGLISFRMDWLDLLAVQEPSPTPQFKSIKFFGAQLSL